MKTKRSNVVRMRRPKKVRRRRSFGPEHYLKYLPIVFVALAVVVFVLTPRVVETVEFDAQDVRVIDADTIAVGRSAIRLTGVDAPERGEFLHEAGKAFLGRFLRASETVTCDLIQRLSYDRRIGRCFFIDGDGNATDIQHAIIAEGFATPFLRYGGWRYIPAMFYRP